MGNIFKRCIVIVAASLLTPGIVASAHSSSNSGYLFKNKATKMYSYPRTLHAHAKYLGRVGTTKTVYFAVGSVHAKGINYVKLAWPVTERLDGSQVLYSIPSGYVRRSSVKRVKLLLTQAKSAPKPYWLKTTAYNFWAHPYGTVQHNLEIRASAEQSAKTLYVVGQAKTWEKRTYLKVQTKAGKQLGWINRKALGAGPYQDPTRYLTRGTSLTKTTWVNPQDSRVKVTSLVTKHELKKLIIQNSDGTAVVVLWNGGPNTYFQMESNHVRTKQREFNSYVQSKNLDNMNFDSQAGQIRLWMITPDKNPDVTYLVNVDLAGDFSSVEKVKTLFYV